MIVLVGGSNFVLKKTATAVECQAGCAARDDCLRFTFCTTCETDNTNCWYFPFYDELIERAGYISGPPSC